MRGDINPRYPRALAICDRCGARYNHDELTWQFQWVGPRLQNLRKLVCASCLDFPQEQLRTVILPPDPVPTMNARPEASVKDMNPLSGIGVNENAFTPQYGNFIGTLTEGGGLNAAFNAHVNKPSFQSASISISDSSYGNWVGINWTGNQTTTVTPPTMTVGVITHAISSAILTAPLDQSFLASGATSYLIQGSSVGGDTFSDWTTLASGTTSGTAGEEIAVTLGTGTQYQYHRVAFLGDGLSQISIAQAYLSVAEIGSPTL